MNAIIRIIGFLVMMICSTLVAQSSWIKCKVILMSTDSLHGYLSTPTLQPEASTIFFKKTMNGKVKPINKKQIQSIISPFEQYDSYEYINHKLKTLDELSERQRDTIIPFKDTLFLELIVKGTINLYRLNQSKMKDRYFISSNGNLQELIGNKLTVNGYRTSDEYKIILQEYYRICKRDDYSPKLIHFNLKDLAESVQHENECTGKVDFVKNIKTDWRLQALIGMTNSLMRYEYPLRNNWRDLNWRSSNLPCIGIAVTPLQYHKPNRFLFMAEGMVQHQNTFTDIHTEENFTSVRGTVHMETLNLKFNLLGQGYIINQKTKVYLVGGVSNSFPVSIPVNNVRLESVDFLGQPSIKNSEAINKDELLNFDFYIVMGAGIEFQKFTLEYREDYSDGLSKNLSLLSNYRNRYLILKYKL